MALIKKIETVSGIEAEYWRVVRVGYDADSKAITANFQLFKDKRARLANKDALFSREFSFADFDNSNPVKFCYDKLKATDEFKDATDD